MEDKIEEYVVYPEIQEVFEEGMRDGSYLAGFVEAFGEIELSEQSLVEILLKKMELGYNKEFLRMQLASSERNTLVLAENGVSFSGEGDF